MKAGGAGMISSVKPIRVPAAVSNKLKEVGNEKRKQRLATWLVGGLAVLLSAMCLAMFVDWTLTLFSPVRRCLLTTATLAAVAVLLSAWWIRIIRGYKPAELASEVDGAIPQLEERWSTVTEIAGSPPEHHIHIHRGIMNRLSSEAEAWEPRVRAEEVLSPRPLVIAWGALCGMILVLFLAFACDWTGTSVLIRRFWMPTANISATRIALQSGDRVTARGEPFALKATMESRAVPEAVLFLCAEDGDTQRVMLFAQGDNGDQLLYRVKSAEESFDFRIRAGDGQTDWRSVTVADRPELAGVRFRVIPPEYAGQEHIVRKELPYKVSILEGSRVEVALRTREDVAKVTLKMTEARRSESSKRPLREESLEPDEKGWYHCAFVPQERVTISPVLTERHGLENRRPPSCKIHVYRDQPPAVRILSPNEDIAIRAQDSLDIRFKAEDDIGVSRAELVVYKATPESDMPAELDVIEIPLEDGEDVKKVQGSVELELAKYQLREGDELDYAVRVYDNRRSSSSSKAKAELADRQGEPSSPAKHMDGHADPNRPDPAASASATKPAPRQSHFKPETPQRSRSGQIATRTPGSVPSDSQSASKSPSAQSPNAPGDKPPRSEAKGRRARQPLASANASSKALSSQMQETLTEDEDSRDAVSSAEQPQSNTPGSHMAAAAQPSKPGKTGRLTGAPMPPDNMSRRMLDVGQCTCSGKKRIRVDRWAGSYASKQREKLEMAVAPELENLDKLLAKAETLSRQALDRLEHKQPWSGLQDRWLSTAEKTLQASKKNVSELRDKTAGTPYAFIGLQLTEIVQSHVGPARESLWTALNADADPVRLENVRDGWQRICRARQRLRQLHGQFDRIRREHSLADKLIRVKTMYRVFLEDSFAMLNSKKPPINNYERSMVQFDLTDEDLKRIQEILEMKRDLKAELARILSEDPRLLKRFTDRVARRTETLRDQLTLLAQRQKRIDRELRAWMGVTPEDEASLQAAITRIKLAEAGCIASAAAEMHEHFVVWLPLDMKFADGLPVEVRDLANDIAGDARALQNAAASHGDDARTQPGENGDLSSYVRQGKTILGKLEKLDILLRRLTVEHDHAGPVQTCSQAAGRGQTLDCTHLALGLQNREIGFGKDSSDSGNRPIHACVGHQRADRRVGRYRACHSRNTGTE